LLVPLPLLSELPAGCTGGSLVPVAESGGGMALPSLVLLLLAVVLKAASLLPLLPSPPPLLLLVLLSFPKAATRGGVAAVLLPAWPRTLVRGTHSSRSRTHRAQGVVRSHFTLLRAHDMQVGPRTRGGSYAGIPPPLPLPPITPAP